MLEHTKTAIRAICAADATIRQDNIKRALAVLDGEETPRPIGRVIRTTDAARILGVTTKSLRRWALLGALVPVQLPGQKLRTGYTEASVRALAEAKTTTAEV